MIHTLIGKTRFVVYGHLRKKIVRALLKPKTDNILPDLDWVMTDGIRATLFVLLRDGRTNFSEDTESSRGCM